MEMKDIITKNRWIFDAEYETDDGMYHIYHCEFTGKVTLYPVTELVEDYEKNKDNVEEVPQEEEEVKEEPKKRFFGKKKQVVKKLVE